MIKENGNTLTESELRMRYLKTFGRTIAGMLCQKAVTELQHQVNPLGSVSRGTAGPASDFDIEILFPNCLQSPLSGRVRKEIEAKLNKMAGFPVQLWVSVGQTGQCFDHLDNLSPESLDILTSTLFGL